MAFSARQIEHLRPNGRRYEIREADGLGIRVSKRGVRSWVFIYDFEGRRRRMTLGTFPAMTLSQARRAHLKARSRLIEGIDPAQEVLEAKKKIREEPLFRDLCEDYLERHARKRKKSWRTDAGMLQGSHIPQEWRLRRISSITRRDVARAVQAVSDQGHPAAARILLSVLSRMFRYAIETGQLEQPINPCAMVPRPLQNPPRRRSLDDDELRQFFKMLPNCGMSLPVQNVLRLIVFTGTRCGEAVNLPWSELDLESKLWHLPAERSKNGKAHSLPLSTPAVELLRSIPRIDDSHWVFPSPQRDGPYLRQSVTLFVQRAQPVFGLKKFTAHDLRRTVATGLARLGYQEHLIARVLNHSPGRSVTAIVYNQHGYEEEMRGALEAWGTTLASLGGAGL